MSLMEEFFPKDVGAAPPAEPETPAIDAGVEALPEFEFDDQPTEGAPNGDPVREFLDAQKDAPEAESQAHGEAEPEDDPAQRIIELEKRLKNARATADRRKEREQRLARQLEAERLEKQRLEEYRMATEHRQQEWARSESERIDADIERADAMAQKALEDERLSDYHKFNREIMQLQARKLSAGNPPPAAAPTTQAAPTYRQAEQPAGSNPADEFLARNPEVRSDPQAMRKAQYMESRLKELGFSTADPETYDKLDEMMLMRSAEEVEGFLEDIRPEWMPGKEKRQAAPKPKGEIPSSSPSPDGRARPARAGRQTLRMTEEIKQAMRALNIDPDDKVNGKANRERFLREYAKTMQRRKP